MVAEIEMKSRKTINDFARGNYKNEKEISGLQYAILILIISLEKFLTDMSDKIRKTFLYNLLVSPSFRVWRHVLAIVCVAIVAVSRTYVTFYLNIPALGNTIYLIFLCSIVAFGVVIYYNIYILVPKYLLKKKYAIYITSLGLSVLLLVLFEMLTEYLVYTLLDLPHERTSYFNPVSIIDLLSNFVMNTLCIAGIAMTILLRHWMIEESRVTELEKAHVHSEVERLKEQANPQFLSNILRRASSLTATNPEKASDMLYKLSQLLRYQLYDCAREKVLLASEISYLGNYLALEQQYSETFRYNIDSEGDINRAFIPPLLFIPFVHEVVEQVRATAEAAPSTTVATAATIAAAAAEKEEETAVVVEAAAAEQEEQEEEKEATAAPAAEVTAEKENDSLISVHFKVAGNSVCFWLRSGAIRQTIETSLDGIRRRLDILYPANYKLNIHEGLLELELVEDEKEN